MLLLLFFPFVVSLDLLLFPHSFAPLLQFVLMLDSLCLLSCPIGFPLLLLSRLLQPRFLDPFFPGSLMLFPPDPLFFKACLPDFLPPNTLIFSLLLHSLILNPACLRLFMPLPLLLLIFSLPYFFGAAGLLNQNAFPFLFFDTTLLNFLLSFDADGLLPLTILFLALFSEFALVLFGFLLGLIGPSLLSDALFLFLLAVVLLPVSSCVVLLVRSADVVLLGPVVGVASVLVVLVLLVFVFVRIVCVLAPSLSTCALSSCPRELCTVITALLFSLLFKLFRSEFSVFFWFLVTRSVLIVDAGHSANFFLLLILRLFRHASLREVAFIAQGGEVVSAKLVERASGSRLVGG